MSTYLFGQYLLEEGVIDAEQLYEALQHQQHNNRVLGELACEEGMLSAGQVGQILEWQLCEDRDFGEVAVEMGMLDEASLEKLLRIQKDKHLYLGDALVAIGALEQEALERELERYDTGREDTVAAEEQAEDGEDIPLAVWSIFSRVLSRFTHGTVMSGGFYPTITPPVVDSIYSQKITGDMELELIIKMARHVEELIAGSRDGKSLTDFLTSVLAVFCSAMEANGKAISPVGKPTSLDEKELSDRKEKAEQTSCVEFFLVQPPLPDGEFYQVNACLLLGAGA